MRTPFFSIIIPTYNRALLLSNAINSVLAQTFTDWELIIMDDGSTDNTRSVVEKFQDARINYVWQQNAERSAARNNGISLTRGEFICFLDSDDLWRDYHLQTHFDAIKGNDRKKAFYFTGMTWNFPDRKQDVIFEPLQKKNPIEYVITNQIGTPTVCIHHSILSANKFNTTLRINEDVELFARIVSQHELIRIPMITVDVMVHDENTKGQERNYISPQIEAMKTIFSNALLRNKISPAFKRARLLNLRHQLINHYLNSGEFSKMNKEILHFLFSYPLHFQNKAKIVLLLYHVPGGKYLQKLVGKLKTV